MTRLRLWLRWHRNFLLKFPATEEERQQRRPYAKIRLASIAQRINNLETEVAELYPKIHPDLREREGHAENVERYKAKEKELTARRHEYRELWNILRDTDMLVPEWGSRETFLNDPGLRRPDSSK